MINTNAVQERIDQLAAEREGLLINLQQLEAERVRIQHLISGYDGAIGELSRLVATSGASGAAQLEGAE